MFRVGLLLCSVAICVYSVTGSDPTPTSPTPASPPTTLEFSCDDETGTISIKSDGLNDYPSIFAIGTKSVSSNVNESNQLCDVIDAPLNTGYKFEIKQCKPDFPVTVYIMKVPSQNQNKGVSPTSGAVTLPPNGFVIGGDGVAAYSLECFKDSKAVNLPDIFTVTKKSELSLSSTMSTHAPEGRVYIDLLILNTDGSSVNANSMVPLGTQLIVLIKGPAGPIYHVNQCRAYSSKDEGNTTTVLVSDTYTRHPELMKNFTVSTNTSIKSVQTRCNKKFCMETTLYAFRFKSDYSVTLECTIDVCNSYVKCPASTSFNGSVPTFQRRRRESDSKLHVLRSTIVVQDHLPVNVPETTSDGNMHRTPFYLIATLAALWVFRILA